MRASSRQEGQIESAQEPAAEWGGLRIDWLGRRQGEGRGAAGLRRRAGFPGNRVFPGLRHGSRSFGSLERPTRDTATGDHRKPSEGPRKRRERAQRPSVAGPDPRVRSAPRASTGIDRSSRQHPWNDRRSAEPRQRTSGKKRTDRRGKMSVEDAINYKPSEEEDYYALLSCDESSSVSFTDFKRFPIIRDPLFTFVCYSLQGCLCWLFK